MKQDLAAKSVLIIDDDANFGKIMTKMGPRVALSMHAVTSLGDLPHDGPIQDADIILVDYDLEDMTGLEVAEILNNFYPGKPVIMISSTNRPVQEQTLNLPNVAGFASKWQSPHEFLYRVREFV